MLEKIKWRYMQFDPQRYPANVDFKIVTTMGVVAREVEAAQLTQTLGMIGGMQEFHGIALQLVEGIVDHTSISNKQQIITAIRAVTNPSPQAQKQAQAQQAQAQHMQDQMNQALLQKTMLENQKLVAEIKDILGKASNLEHQAAVNTARVQQDWEDITLKRQEQQQFAEQNNIAKARLPIEAMKAQAALISAKRKPAGAQ